MIEEYGRDEQGRAIITLTKNSSRYPKKFIQFLTLTNGQNYFRTLKEDEFFHSEILERILSEFEITDFETFSVKRSGGRIVKIPSLTKENIYKSIGMGEYWRTPDRKNLIQINDNSKSGDYHLPPNGGGIIQVAKYLPTKMSFRLWNKIIQGGFD